MVYKPFQLIRTVNIFQDNNLAAREELELMAPQSSLALKYLFEKETFRAFFGKQKI